jgi:hypothetical protein
MTPAVFNSAHHGLLGPSRPCDGILQTLASPSSWRTSRAVARSPASPVGASPKGVPAGAARAPKTGVHDRDVGTVRSFLRTVPIDLEACRRAFEV